eukprot:gene30966-41223_t
MASFTFNGRVGAQDAPGKSVDNNVAITGKWVPALNFALSRFIKENRGDISCYKVTAYEGDGVLEVYFYAAPLIYDSGVRGEAKSCGRSFKYFVSSSARIVGVERIR